MSQARWDRVKQIFHEVREKRGAERERLLGVLCGDDGELVAQVRALLSADDEAGEFLGSPTRPGAGEAGIAAAAVAAAPPPEGPGSRIGPYKLLQVIGEGGFGVVYMAEQDEPIRRRVALKVVKPGMDSKQVVTRFEAERQALATLDHPNIAKVFDAGTTSTGRPYFVMELVRGIPITDYCDEHRLDTHERMALFAQVCGAVNHANQNGIVHRDVKPSNVLVTLHDGTPVPKVIDFGVAKALNQRLTEATLFTEYNQFVGTPAYMSPEQAAYGGLEVDGRSDVYSLGVLLYELLTGTTPLDARQLRQAAYLEVLRVLQEDDPPKPSTRISTMGAEGETHARYRHSDPARLARLLKGDIDWIVMKSLEKDRTRRYDSAAAMAEDIARYFRQEPIVARPPSKIYRARKFARRRRGPVLAAGIVLFGLLAEVTYLSWQRSQMAAATPGLSPARGPQTELLMTSENHPCFFGTKPSPDGAKFVYTNICDEPGIYLYDAAADATRRISRPEYHWGLAWAPDGRRVIVSRADGSYRWPYIIDVETGASETPAALAGLSLEPTQWSPDGNLVSGRSRGPGGDVSTVVVSLSTGDLTTLAEGVRQGQGSAAFSPDGRYVVYSDVGEESEDLFVTELATGARWGLTAGPEDDGEALWSPDGAHIVFRNMTGTWAVAVSEGRPGGEPSLVRREAFWPSAWTDKGYYYDVDNSVARGHRLGVDPRTGKPTGERESFSLPAADLPNLRFAWAPDMERAAVAGWGDGLLHVMRAGAVSSLPIGPELLPSNLWWTGDGSKVLLTTAGRAQRDRSAKTVLAVTVGDGTVHELFPRMEDVQQLHVSPDGRQMVSLRPAGSGSWRELVLSPLGQREGKVLATRTSDGDFATIHGQPLISPDGSRVLFLRIPEEGPLSLRVVDVDGSDERELATADGFRSPLWDPSGRLIAFHAWDGGTSSLRVVDTEDGSTHDIEAFGELESPQLHAWSPDGAWLAVSETMGRSEYWVNRDLIGAASP